MNPETLARLVFCFENNPEREDEHISGAQDAIGICVPGLCRHYYEGSFWPRKIENTNDEMTLRFLESHLVLIPMTPRLPGCSVVKGRDITLQRLKLLPKQLIGVGVPSEPMILTVLRQPSKPRLKLRPLCFRG